MNQDNDNDLEIPEQTAAPGGVRGKYYGRYKEVRIWCSLLLMYPRFSATPLREHCTQAVSRRARGPFGENRRMIVFAGRTDVGRTLQSDGSEKVGLESPTYVRPAATHTRIFLRAGTQLVREDVVQADLERGERMAR